MWSRENRDHLAGEQGAVHKDWGGKLPIALVYPNSYYLGMSNLGIHAVYAWLNRISDVVCERVFREKPGKGTPYLPVSVESQRPLTDFAVLAFSVTYELDYFHIPQMLKAAGIPLYSRERDETQPLIIAGGPCMTANPMPVAPFFDAICVGEAEAILPGMVPVLRAGIQGAVSRLDTLTAMSHLPGVYVPQQPAPTMRRWTKDLDDHPVHSTVLTHDTELGNMYLIEVERGCPWGCRFCLVCGAFNPMRTHSLESLTAQAEEGLKYRKRIGLVGPDVPDHPDFEKLLVRLRDRGAEIGISSMRIKPLYPLALAEIARTTGSVAFAPEGGSERLRRVIKKSVTEDDIMVAMEAVAAQDIKQLRLYFMIGLPTETDDDVQAIVDLTVKCKSIVERMQRGIRITLSVSPFVPKAGTPFQWLPMEKVDTLDRRLAELRTRLRPKGVAVSAESPAWSAVQGTLARGDEALAAVLADVDEVSLPVWRRALLEHGIDGDSYACRTLDTARDLPWAMIESGRTLDQLKAELELGLR